MRHEHRARWHGLLRLCILGVLGFGLIGASPAAAASAGTSCAELFVTEWVGQSASIAASPPCTALTGTTSVQWEVSTDGGATWSNDTTDAGATTNTITVTSATPKHELLEPVFSAAGGSSLGYETDVTVAAFPTVASETVTPGSTATFQIETDVAGFPIQWQLSTDGGATWSNDTTDAGATTDTLTVANVGAVQDGEQLRAQLGSFAGTATTAPATLTVGATTSAPPVITTNPVYASVCPGASASFTAAATGSPTPTSVQWQVSTQPGTWFNDTTDPGNGADTLTATAPPGQIDWAEYLRAVFTNAVGSTTTDNAWLSTPPLIHSDPDGAFVYPGQSASFTVTPDACYPTATVQWYSTTSTTGAPGTNGPWSAVAGATAKTFTLADATSGGPTGYEAAVSLGSTTVFSQPARLVVLSVPTPAPQFVTPGETATFSVPWSSIAGGGLQWQVSTDGGATWSDDTADAGATSNPLTVADATLAENGEEFRLVISDAAGTVDTPAATLTVETTPPPTITLQPANVSVCYGLPAVFTAAASGDPAPTVQWQVSTDDGQTWTNDTTDAGNMTDSLSVSQPSQFVEYRAVFTNSHGDTATNAADVFGDFFPPPFIFTQPVLAGQSETLSVPSISCYGAEPVQWLERSTVSGAWVAIPGATSPTLTLPTATVGEDADQYEVVVEAGSRPTSSGSPEVRGVPVPADATVTAGASASFTAAPNGFGLPSDWSIQWQVSTDAGATWTDDTTDAGATSETLTVANASPTQNGQRYRAAITDPAGVVVTPAATLTVLSAPTVTTQPVAVTVTSPAPAQFAAAASGNPVPTVQWQVSSDGGATWATDASDGGNATTTLSVSPTAQVLSGRLYRAVFTNSVGTAMSAAAKLTVQPANAPTVTSVTPDIGGPFSLVIVRGTNLVRPTSVSFGAGHRALFLGLSHSLLLALAPPGATGTVDVTVATRAGTSGPSSADHFTYR